MTEDTNRTIAVIGATGRTGRHIVAGLLDRGVAVRALVRHPLTAGLPEQVTVVPGSIEDLAALSELVDGADAAFLLWPGHNGDPADAVAALAVGVDHLVYLSAAAIKGTDSGEVMEGPWADVERAIADSGVSWTFVRAGGFAANTLEWAGQIRAGDTVRMPYPEAGRSLIDERDIAAVAVRALLDPAFGGRAITITGPAVLTQREQVAAIGAALGRELTVEQSDVEQARQEYAEAMGAEFADRSLGYWASLVDEPEAVTGRVADITGHPARSFAAWARDNRYHFARLSTAQVAQAYGDALRGGDMNLAGRLLADDIVRVAPLEEGGREVEVRGLRAIAENAERQNTDADLLGVEVSEPLVGDDRFALRFVFDERMRSSGEPRTTVKLSLCTVEASRIVREEVFYFQGGPTHPRLAPV